MFIRTFIRRMSTSMSAEKSLNKVTIIGRVGADAKLQGTFEHPVVNFSVATGSGSKSEWHRVSVFRPGLRSTAENHVKKGMRVYVEGKISYGHLIDSKGQANAITTIIADDIIFLTWSTV